MPNTGPIRLDTLLFSCYMLMGSVSGRTTVQVHLAHSYSETCGDNTGEMPGLSLLLI